MNIQMVLINNNRFLVIKKKNQIILALMKLQDIFQIHSPTEPPVTLRQLGPGPDYRSLLKEIQNSGETRVILDCALDKILEIFRQAKDVKMMEDYQV